jgi:hypothetical protein
MNAQAPFVTLDPKVIQYDHNQAEFTLNFWRYMNSRVSNNRLKKGKVKLEEIRPLLERIYKKYGVQPSIEIVKIKRSMNRSIAKLYLISIVLVLGACGASEKINTFTGSTMGTTYTVKTIGQIFASKQSSKVSQKQH